MIGKRLEIVYVDGKPDLNACLPRNPGEYVGPIRGYTGDKLAVFFLKPNARDPGVPAHARSVQHVTSPPHTFHQEKDGTLTIKPSISDMRSSYPEEWKGERSDGWHGYLTRGVWILA